MRPFKDRRIKRLDAAIDELGAAENLVTLFEREQITGVTTANGCPVAVFIDRCLNGDSVAGGSVYVGSSNGCNVYWFSMSVHRELPVNVRTFIQRFDAEDPGVVHLNENRVVKP